MEGSETAISDSSLLSSLPFAPNISQTNYAYDTIFDSSY